MDLAIFAHISEMMFARIRETLRRIHLDDTVPKFDEEMLELLESRNPDICYEAVQAAWNRGLDAAWPHVAALITSEATEMSMLLAAIGAAASIRPQEAAALVVELVNSEDEDIAGAASDALMEAGVGRADDEDEDENGDSLL